MLLQFLIVKVQDKDEGADHDDSDSDDDDNDGDDSDDDDDDDDDPDPVVLETWKFIKEHWELDKPKLIISVIYDLENPFMNRRLLQSILADLIKTAATVEGKQT